MKPNLLSRFLEETIHKKPLKKELVGTLLDLFRIYAPSGGERPTVDYCAGVLRRSGFSLIIDETHNNIIASRGKFSTNDKLVCINAHTDTVQRKEDEHVGSLVGYDWARDAFHTNNRAILGGDDKCGIGVALTLAAYTRLPMKIILTSGEEVGSIGATALEKNNFDDVAFTFTIDRKGANDVITEYCGLTLAPDTFVKKFIELSADIGLTFKETYGTYADTYILCKYAPAVNLSSGYYNPHSKNEFVLADETYNTMLAVKNAIEHKGELEIAIATSPPDWQKDLYAGYGGGGYAVEYGGHWGGMYGLDGGWYGATGAMGGGARARARMSARVHRPRGKGTIDYYGKGHGKGTPRKCKIEYEKTRGLDDKEFVKKRLDDHGIRWSTEELMNAYSIGGITDSEWDSFLMEGSISTAEHRRGVDMKIEAEKNGTSLSWQDQPTESYVPRGASVDDLEDEFDETAVKELEATSDMLARYGIHSGYLTGTVEDMLFVEYVTGEIAKEDLDDYRASESIDPWFYDNCIDARATFVRIQMAESGAKPTQVLQTTGKGVVYGWGETGADTGGEEPTLLPPPPFLPMPPIFDSQQRSIRDTLAARGFRSGHKMGTVEDDVFVEYLSGQMTKFQLREEVRDGLDAFFAETCIDFKEEYDELFPPVLHKELRIPNQHSAQDMLRIWGLKSGFDPGTEEDSIFITYVIGLMSEKDMMRSIKSCKFGGINFQKHCINSKIKYDKLQRLEKISPGSTFIDLIHLIDEPIKQNTTITKHPTREMLIKRGIVSGFDRGSEPDNLFITYVFGLMSESDLADSAIGVALHGKIKDFKVSPFKEHCINAKKIYEAQERGLINVNDSFWADDCRGA